MHDVFRSIRSVTKCAKLLLSVPFNIGLILADLHILYATKQNKNHYHQTRFLGLKWPQNMFSPYPAGGACSAPPKPSSCIWREEEKGKGWEGRGGQERGGKGQGREGERREREKKEGGEGMAPHFLGQDYALHDGRFGATA